MVERQGQNKRCGALLKNRIAGVVLLDCMTFTYQEQSSSTKRDPLGNECARDFDYRRWETQKWLAEES